MNTYLGAYLPIDRCDALARGSDLPDRISGAVLFADISGFTGFTTALASELGPRRGPEQLGSHMNRIYDALIAEVHRYGGSAIGFSGDAITCWFADDSGLRGLTCAFAMLAVIRPLATISTPSGRRFSLALKVCVAAGPARRFLVGDPQVCRLDVLAGPLLDTVAAANRVASPGSILADSATIARLGQQVSVRSWRGDPADGAAFGVIGTVAVWAAPTPWQAPPQLSAEEARRWLWPSVYARLLRSPDQLLSELRPTVSLFVALGAIDYSQDDAEAMLDAYIRYVQSVVIAYEGNLVDLTIGDKGSYLYICFGAPVAHNNDAVRAVAAALDLIRTPSQHGQAQSLRIGVAQGLMYTGIYGGGARRTYGVLGEKVNLAARLMEHARPGQICCDEQTYAQAHRYWGFRPLPPASVKGWSTPIAIYSPTGQRMAALAERGAECLIGREAELNQLRTLLEASAAGPQVLLLTGEAGIGKSRMVGELSRLAKARGMAVLRGAGQSIEQHTPYRAWRDILRAHFAIDERGDLAQHQDQVQREIARSLPTLQQRAPLLNDILHLELPEAAITAGLDPELRKESLTTLIIEILRAGMRNEPLLLAIDDAHWLDTLSWQLVLQVARACAAAGTRLLLALAARPPDDQEWGSTALAALLTLGHTTAVVLGSLPSEQASAIAAAQLGIAPHELPHAVAEVVQQRSGGNPFFAEELALALRDQGMIAIEHTQPADGQPAAAICRVTGDLASASQALPDTLHGLILSRIDRLPPDQQLTLKVASVIGRTFTYTALQHILHHYSAIPANMLQDHLAALIAHDLASVEAAEPEVIYGFKHIITHDVAYHTLLFAQRREIHQIIARWYEQGHTPASKAALYPLLAHHYRQAEDDEHERIYARLAGEQAAARYANDEALAYLDRALALTPPQDHAERYQLCCAREKVYDLQGARAKQLRDLQALAALAQQLGSQQQAEVALRRSIFAEHTGDPATAIEAVRKCIQLAHAQGRADIEAAGYQWWGIILWAQGSLESRGPLERALALAYAHGLTGLAAQSLAALGSLALLRGECAAAQASYEQALAHYRAVGDQRGESTTINNLGIVAHTQSDHSRARALYEQALRLKRTMGDRRGEAKALTSLGSLLESHGRYAPARSHYEQALAIYREIDGRAGESEVLLSLGGLTYQLGDLDAACDYSQQALRLAQALRADDAQARALLPLGHALAALGQAAQAAAAYRQAMAIWRGLGLANQAMAPLAGLAQLALDTGRPRSAQRATEQILAHLERGALDGADEPLQIYLTCFRVLQQRGDQRASATLATAHRLLCEQAEQIEDGELRRSFLEGVAAHRNIAQAFRQSQGCMTHSAGARERGA